MGAGNDREKGFMDRTESQLKQEAGPDVNNEAVEVSRDDYEAQIDELDAEPTPGDNTAEKGAVTEPGGDAHALAYERAKAQVIAAWVKSGAPAQAALDLADAVLSARQGVLDSINAESAAGLVNTFLADRAYLMPKEPGKPTMIQEAAKQDLSGRAGRLAMGRVIAPEAPEPVIEGRPIAADTVIAAALQRAAQAAGVSVADIKSAAGRRAMVRAAQES